MKQRIRTVVSLVQLASATALGGCVAASSEEVLDVDGSSAALTCRISFECARDVPEGEAEEWLQYCHPQEQDDGKGERYLVKLPEEVLESHRAELVTGTMFVTIPGGHIEGSQLIVPEPDKISAIKAPESYIAKLADRSARTHGKKRILAVLVHTRDAKSPVSVQEMRTKLFGDDFLSVKTQYKKCSYDKLQFVPSAQGDVIEIQVDGQTSSYDRNTMVTAVEQKFKSRYGVAIGSGTDHVMFCLPDGVMGGGVASVGGSYSTYGGRACVSNLVVMHELGHNLGSGHAHEYDDNGNRNPYGDGSTWMGAVGGRLASPTDTQCFNGYDHWQYGWYRDKQLTLTPTKGTPQTVKIAAFTDYQRLRAGEHVVVRLSNGQANVGGYFLQYNRKEAFNASVLEKGDEITLVEDMTGTLHSMMHAGLDLNDHTYAIERFKGADTLYVRVCGKVDGGSNADFYTVSVGYEEHLLCGEARGARELRKAGVVSEERVSDGFVYGPDANIELFANAEGVPQHVGVRFESLGIPKGAKITHAYVQFTGKTGTLARPKIRVEGDNTGHSRPFTRAAKDLSARPTTTASVNWQTYGFRDGRADFAERTLNLRTIVQEIVSRPDWNSGNALSLVFSRAAEDTTSNTSIAQGSPTLIVRYDSDAPPGGGDQVVSNVALGKTTTQSSTDYRGVSSRAVDGNTSGRYLDGSVTHTLSSSRPWWLVNLGGAHRLERLTIYNRTDCCSDRLSNFRVDYLDAAGAVIATSTVPGSSGAKRDISLAATGVHAARIQLNGTNPLSLAEVQVWGAPSQ